MPIILATKTMEAIDKAIEADGGNSYRTHLRKLMMEAEEPFKLSEGSFRSHFGFSQAGQDCSRAMWYSWHWAQKKQISGRIQRLFNRGHMEEPRLLACLLTIGCKVWSQDEDGNQFRVSMFGGHAGSAIDGVVLGLPDAPEHPLLAEFKTHNNKSFTKLKKEGVRSSKFVHYVQMQVYMKLKNLYGALYMAVNKDDDEIYCELVQYDEATADRFIERVQRTIYADKAPPGIPGNGPGFHVCKWCDFYDVCQLSSSPERNCRTCTQSIAREDGTWYCTHYGVELTKENQLAGCQTWEMRAEFRA